MYPKKLTIEQNFQDMPKASRTPELAQQVLLLEETSVRLSESCEALYARLVTVMRQEPQAKTEAAAIGLPSPTAPVALRLNEIHARYIDAVKTINAILNLIEV